MVGKIPDRPYPTASDEAVPGLPITYLQLDKGLRCGYYGLPGGSSLRQEAIKRGYLKVKDDLTEMRILGWARDFFNKTGRWPSQRTKGKSPEGDTWDFLDRALKHGYRGLPGGSSLSILLGPHKDGSLKIREEQILAWADAYFNTNGKWPSQRTKDEPVHGITWEYLDKALKYGWRGLPGGHTLPEFLRKHGRGREARKPRKPLTEHTILSWAESYFERNGKWPSQRTKGRLPSGDTWGHLDKALKHGWRGLPGGSSLSSLLAPHKRRD